MATGKHIFRGVVEVPRAKTVEQAVNLGQVKDLVDRYNKEPVRVATTTELQINVKDPISGRLELKTNIDKIDNVSVSVDDAILVKGQLDKTENGVYVIDDLGSITPANATASVSGTGVTAATVSTVDFETKISTTGSYDFIYDGVTDMAWKYIGTIVTLSDYGIVETGVPVDGDTITVSYTATSGTGAVLLRREDFAIGKVILNNTFVNVMVGDSNGDTRWTIVSDGVLTCGTSSFTFIKDIDVDLSPINVVKSTFNGTGVDTSFTVSHNLNLTDGNYYLIFIKDNVGNNVYVDNIPTVGNEKNSITLTFEEAPKVTEEFKVFVLGLV